VQKGFISIPSLTSGVEFVNKISRGNLVEISKKKSKRKLIRSIYPEIWQKYLKEESVLEIY